MGRCAESWLKVCPPIEEPEDILNNLSKCLTHACGYSRITRMPFGGLPGLKTNVRPRIERRDRLASEAGRCLQAASQTRHPWVSSGCQNIWVLLVATYLEEISLPLSFRAGQLCTDGSMYLFNRLKLWRITCQRLS